LRAASHELIGRAIWFRGPAFGPERDGDWRLVAASVNRMPASASYLRRPVDTDFWAFKLDVLRVDGTAIAEITTFGYAWFAAGGLPQILSPA
jgi:hypothetical protein